MYTHTTALHGMNLMFMPLLLLLFGVNSCQKDKENFDDILEERLSENNEDSFDEIVLDSFGNDEASQTSGLKAFPTAYGAGSYVSGGRGKKVFLVTNLADDGQGSFRQALRDAATNNGGTILFRVSGTIELKERTYFKVNNLTIAGQSAPAGGIDITGESLVFEDSNNIIIRYVRFRPTYGDFDSLGFLSSDNIILDHCSLSWGGDEVLDFWGDTDNVTVQKVLMAEGKTGSLLGDSDNPSISENLSMHHCLFYNISHRFPNPNSNGRIDVINNVIFNWKYRLSTPTGNVKLNHINNYYALGCLTSMDGLENKIFEGDSPKIYTAGNYVDKGILTQSKQDNWILWKNFYSNTQAPSAFNVKKPYAFLGEPVPIVDAEQAFTQLTTNIGANRILNAQGEIESSTDQLDEMYLTNAFAKKCSEYNSSSFGQNFDNTPHYVEYHSKVNTIPKASHPMDFDTDLDGMPDIWEVKTFGNLQKDGRQDTDSDGYTDLEEYLNLVDNLP